MSKATRVDTPCKKETMNFYKIAFRGILALVIAWFLNTQLFTSRGFYNADINMLHCKTGGADTCWHELGHYSDEMMGYPSKTQDFTAAVQLYLINQIRFGTNLQGVSTIFNTPGILNYSRGYQVGGNEMFSNPQSELYANIFMDAKGDLNNIDAGLRRFYYQGDYQTMFESAMAHNFIFVKE